MSNKVVHKVLHLVVFFECHYLTSFQPLVFSQSNAQGICMESMPNLGRIFLHQSFIPTSKKNIFAELKLCTCGAHITPSIKLCVCWGAHFVNIWVKKSYVIMLNFSLRRHFIRFLKTVNRSPHSEKNLSENSSQDSWYMQLCVHYPAYMYQYLGQSVHNVSRLCVYI